jgi:hypothetical protein
MSIQYHNPMTNDDTTVTVSSTRVPCSYTLTPFARFKILLAGNFFLKHLDNSGDTLADADTHAGKTITATSAT